MLKFQVILLFFLDVQATENKSVNIGKVISPKNKIIDIMLKFQIWGKLEHRYISENIKNYCDRHFIKGWIRYTKDQQTEFLKGQAIGSRNKMKNLKYWLIMKNNRFIRLRNTSIKSIIVNIEDKIPKHDERTFNILESIIRLNINNSGKKKNNLFMKEFIRQNYFNDTNNKYKHINANNKYKYPNANNKYNSNNANNNYNYNNANNQYNYNNANNQYNYDNANNKYNYNNTNDKYNYNNANNKYNYNNANNKYNYNNANNDYNYNNANIDQNYNNAKNKYNYDNAKINNNYDNAKINNNYDNAKINKNYENAKINKNYENAKVNNNAKIDNDNAKINVNSDENGRKSYIKNLVQDIMQKDI